MTNVDSKLDVLCERIAHVIHSQADLKVEILEVKRNVIDQNHAVAKVKEWIGVHEEQAQSRSRHICENETRLSTLEQTLQPVIALVRYPLAFGIGIIVIFISALAGIYTSITSILLGA